MTCIIRECECGYADTYYLSMRCRDCPVCGLELAISFDEAGDHNRDDTDTDTDSDIDKE